MAKRTKRLYVGPPGRERSLFYTVKVSDAKKRVEMNGNVLHALKGLPGTSVGCALSNVAHDNPNAFPHPVKLVFIEKTVAWVVDKVSAAGHPTHAVRYEHSYSQITDANDTRTLKKMVKDRPEVMARSFTLRPPRVQANGGVRAPGVKNPTAAKPRAAAFVHRGALARAVKAGLIAAPVAGQLTETLR